jgi:N6-adenosine-specific RNA methylase IME4
MELTKYDAACRALAEARSVDEVKDIRDKAVAIEIYARQANNKDLEANAFEIRKRAERRLGEVMAEMPRAGVGGREGCSENPLPTLPEMGIGKNLAHRARTTAAMPSPDFEKLVANGRDEVLKSVERAVVSKEKRKEKHQEIAARAVAAIASKGPFPVIYADPPWKWGHFGQQDYENEQGKGRTPDQHYPTLTHEEILAFSVDGLSVAELAHTDAALFLWCTSSNLPRASEVMYQWGFQFKSSAAWVKISDGRLQTGTGLVFRNSHEILLYGTRGKMPGPQWQPPSVFLAPRGRHSAKPAIVRQAIEKMYPDFDARSRLELFAREQNDGWTAYGLETAIDIAAE